MDQVRRVLAKQAALFESGHDQRYVALLQVTDAAMHELGGAAAGAFAEVVRLYQDDVKASRRGVYGNAHAGGASANDSNVPRLLLFAQIANHVFALHSWLRFAIRSNPSTSRRRAANVTAA